MIKTREILNNLWPLLPWRPRARTPSEGENTPPDSEKNLEDLLHGRSTSSWQNRKPVDWLEVEDSQDVKIIFLALRDKLYRWNQSTRRGVGQPPRFLWEMGQLSGGRPYFFVQPWNQPGFLFEMNERGWVIVRAEKIASLERFMRQLTVWDSVVLYFAEELPGAVRVRAEQWGDELVSLSLYEDAVLKLFSELTQPESRTKRRIDF